MLPFLSLLSLFTLATAVPQAQLPSSRCVGTISSLSDVDAAIKCTTININSFTVPAGKTFSLNLLQGTTVNVLGLIQFANQSWSGPMLEVKCVEGSDIEFNGHGQTFDGGGTFYWDGEGGSSSFTKPSPMMSFVMSGTLSDVHVLNSPSRAFSINSYYDGHLVVSDVTVDNSQGAYPNDKSNGRPAGRNTDGFDVSGDNIVIKNSVVINQDDCVAINSGRNILFENNHCEDGNGISIGSISSGAVVENVLFQGNSVVNSLQAFRIKTQQSATNSKVTNITFSNNTATNCREYGVVVTQSYPAVFGTPGNGVNISDINFNGGATDINVKSDAEMVAINCGHCAGAWDWSGLTVGGGKKGQIVNCPEIEGYDV